MTIAFMDYRSSLRGAVLSDLGLEGWSLGEWSLSFIPRLSSDALSPDSETVDHDGEFVAEGMLAVETPNEHSVTRRGEIRAPIQCLLVLAIGADQKIALKWRVLTDEPLAIR